MLITVLKTQLFPVLQSTVLLILLIFQWRYERYSGKKIKKVKKERTRKPYNWHFNRLEVCTIRTKFNHNLIIASMMIFHYITITFMLNFFFL